VRQTTLSEVHIYGTFDLNAIESVKGISTSGSRDERDLLRMVKQRLNNAGKAWIEG
jgi:siderophore synthetase component